jgi:hypothetical protein
MKARAVLDKRIIDTSRSLNTFFLEKLVLYAFCTSSEVKRSILAECGSGFNKLATPFLFSKDKVSCSCSSEELKKGGASFFYAFILYRPCIN